MSDFVIKYWVEFLFVSLISIFTALFTHFRKNYKTQNEIQNDEIKLLKDELLILKNTFLAHEEKHVSEWNLHSDSSKAILKDRIIQCCQHHLKKGYFPMYEKESMLGMYRSLIAFGGNKNEVVKDLIAKTKNLPSREKE